MLINPLFSVFFNVCILFILFSMGFFINFYINLKNQGYKTENLVTSIFGFISIINGLILGFTGPIIAFNPLNSLDTIGKISLSLNLAGFGIALISIGFALLTYAENKEQMTHLINNLIHTRLFRNQRFTNLRINRIFRR